MLEYIINFAVTMAGVGILTNINRKFDYLSYYAGVLVGAIAICINSLLN